MIKDAFRKYLEEAIGSENALVAFSAFDSPASTAVRRNPFKPGTCPDGRQVPWAEHGRLLPERPVFTLDPHFHAGAYYVQDSSSMFVGHVFRTLLKDFRCPQGRPLRVLDLCAAPGGKTTDLAASLRERCGDSFILVSNEVMKARAGVLADNVAIWGDPNVVVTSDDPRTFASLPGYFDIIVADVPCSGEGMFRKDEEAQKQWSEDNVALCEARQRRIMADVWPTLASDGIFIYSTCTFNVYENDGNVAWAAAELGADFLTAEDIAGVQDGVIKTRYGYSLVPGHVEGEGQYCGALRKTSDVEFRDIRGRNLRPVKGKDMPLPEDLGRLLSCEVTFRSRGETVIAVPAGIYPELSQLEQNLHVIAAGCAVGTLKGKTLVPDADLALSMMFDRSAFPVAEVDMKTALAFLHRDAVTLADMPKGYVTISYGGLPLGFVKNLGNRCNSLHPQSRRIRMDINK
ncbi:MAG: rRNA cytosine-C5-methyltransferase [Bacteroidales bacterium]|nr:rRNA cytosine-C5-methyltransferase [Bacteroidales bacterium]